MDSEISSNCLTEQVPFLGPPRSAILPEACKFVNRDMSRLYSEHRKGSRPCRGVRVFLLERHFFNAGLECANYITPPQGRVSNLSHLPKYYILRKGSLHVGACQVMGTSNRVASHQLTWNLTFTKFLVGTIVHLKGPCQVFGGRVTFRTSNQVTFKQNGLD